MSASDDEDGDEDELEGDDGGPQEAVPDDGEGSDFDELQVSCVCLAETMTQTSDRHTDTSLVKISTLLAVCRSTLSSLTSSPSTSTACAHS